MRFRTNSSTVVVGQITHRNPEMLCSLKTVGYASAATTFFEIGVDVMDTMCVMDVMCVMCIIHDLFYHHNLAKINF